ncbi:uncharacterized protein LODBEIA_P52340 [Lodderomyces beijingensis]|uniref:Protein FAF1 n=1 Tax=Lodderomyces beijingensis TaxID=1775926 RepID=A0ABP0ZWA5_9ASCO
MGKDSTYLDALEIQRRNFEAQFGTVEELGYEDKLDSKHTKKSTSRASRDEDQSGTEDSDEDDFAGFDTDASADSDSGSDSDSEEEPVQLVPKVVKLNSNTPPPPPAPSSKQERKLLKSGKAATLSELESARQRSLTQTSRRSTKPSDTVEDSENLENDLKLQRLLKESHILASANEVNPTFSGADLTLQTMDYDDPTGKSRKRILSSRIQELTHTNRRHEKKLEKMPMNMRKGMIAKRDARIAAYEKEAKDAGIVLSKLKKGEVRDLNKGKRVTSQSDRLGNGLKSDKVTKMRQRGLKINGVGKSTRNGLVISQSDIDRINNQGKRFNNKKKRR